MAISETRVLPAEYIEAGGKAYLNDLTSAVGGYKGADLSKVYGSQFVAKKDPLQLEAVNQATQGIGSFQPYLNAAQAATGPQGYQPYMSPYQQEVIDQTLQGYDMQAQKDFGSIANNAYNVGAFGGARQGVREAEYQSQSDLNRALLESRMLQQGFQNAQNSAQNQFNQQTSLATQVPNLQGQQVTGLTTLGESLQRQRQSELTAQQQLATQNLNQDLTAAQQLGSGVTSLISGYPGKTIQEQTPNPSGLQSLISAGSGLAGIYRTLNLPKTTD